MTVALTPRSARTAASGRFRLNRAGILNVWQYDDQEFHFAGGRLLLRGANGAGKSKTLEMLLPFALDGDKARITASAKHHTSLLWLMTDGYDGQARQGYVWVEFLRTAADGTEEAFTCGVGIRASASARSATAWHFATPLRVGHDFSLEDESGPLSRPRLEQALGAEHVFEKAAAYKEHIGRTLFGLDAGQYDEMLRLLYWLRQPQVGEDLEPAKLTQQLSQALPQLDDQSVRSAGDTFDELTAFGEQIERRAAAAEALTVLADAYADYARAAVAARAGKTGEALRIERRLRSEAKRAEEAVAEADAEVSAAEHALAAARRAIGDDTARLRTFEDSPEFRDQRRLDELSEQAEHDARLSRKAASRRDRQAEALAKRAAAEDSRRQAAQLALDRHTQQLRALDRLQRKAVSGSPVPIPALLDGLELRVADELAAVNGALDQSLGALQQAQSAVRQRIAGVGVVRAALMQAETLLAAQRQAEEDAERAEDRWEKARQDRVTAAAAAVAESKALTTGIAAWLAAPEAPDGKVPSLAGELTESMVAALPRLAREAATPELSDVHRQRAHAEACRDAAAAELTRLSAERARIEAERDPSPPPPVLPRTQRPDGHPLWQVVDFSPTLHEDKRAGFEAALQASGLLDAWLRPGGALLGPDDIDIALAPAPAVTAPDSLDGLLMPDLPEGSDLRPDEVRNVLAAVGTGADPDAPAWVSPDGSWRLGPAHGRAAKERPQFIGATARAQERARRLELIDAAIAEQTAVRDEATGDQAEATARISALGSWVAEVPSGQALLRAWVTLDGRTGTEEREESDNRAAQEQAHSARLAAAEARGRLDQLAAEQGTPADRGELDALEQELRGLEQDLREAARLDYLRQTLSSWADSAAAREEAAAALAYEDGSAAEAAQRASESRAAFEALKASVGDSVEELQRKIAAVKHSIASHKAAESDAEEHILAARERRGTAKTTAAHTSQGLSVHLAQRAEILGALAAVAGVPGLVEASGADPEDAAVLAGLDGHPAEEPLSRQVAARLDAIAELSAEDAGTAGTKVWRAHTDATSSAAADHQPTVSTYDSASGDLLAVTGSDDAGEASIVSLARRVRASVESDRGLLTEREKQQFEQHVLGELGDAIRRCRRDAEELVAAMNDQLGNVTTSQGIRTRLDWKLRDDVPAEVRSAVNLLAQPVGALLPEERARLRDVLHRLIKASRADRPELSYGEHLAAALDYRTWSEFTIRYTRPERPGQWERLHRRSALSQGEQKVLCYLPLFAAAAAHFHSLAGAAPHAPRLVLLDDAFPMIDVRTHPLLFGLLVQLDLDFVITSERLWGAHDTVPELAIYEALRDPSQRGIAQYAYRWDGRALQAIG